MVNLICATNVLATKYCLNTDNIIIYNKIARRILTVVHNLKKLLNEYIFYLILNLHLKNEFLNSFSLNSV